MPAIVASDGTRLEYAEHGNPRGRVVVLLAGFKAARQSWRFQLPDLADYRVIAVDLRGHGGSARPVHSDMDVRGRDLRDLLESLDLEEVTLVGGSMGGNTIWSYLSQFDDERIAGVVVADQTPKMLNTADWTHGSYGFDASSRDTFYAHGIPKPTHGTPLLLRGMRLVRLLRAMTGTSQKISDGEVALLNDHARRDWRSVIAAAQVPVLFIAGAESEFWPSTHATAAAALATHGKAVVIPQSGHAVNIETPKPFNQALRDFIADQTRD